MNPKQWNTAMFSMLVALVVIAVPFLAYASDFGDDFGDFGGSDDFNDFGDSDDFDDFGGSDDFNDFGDSDDFDDFGGSDDFNDFSGPEDTPGDVGGDGFDDGGFDPFDDDTGGFGDIPGNPPGDDIDQPPITPPPWQPPGAEFDFAIAVNPDHGSVLAGERVAAIVTVTSTGNSVFPVNLQVINCPAGAVCTLGPSLDFPGSSTQFTVQTSTATPAGTYPITIRGTAAVAGTELSRDAVYTLEVRESQNPDRFNFTISVNPDRSSVIPGGNAQANVTVTNTGAATLPVDLQVIGCPSGAVCTLADSLGTPTFSTQLIVQTSSAIHTGAYPITIRGVGGNLAREAAYTLFVGSAPQPPKPEEPKDYLRIFIHQIFLNNPFSEEAGNTVPLSITFENAGTKKLENIKVIVMIPDLAARATFGPLDLGRGERATGRVFLELPEYAEQGVYPVRLQIYSEDAQRTVHREIEVVDYS